ncbi:hypothetical protein MHW47_34345, partial [Streptomyces sp. OfavH-34-F]|nr:hypothetical protein [Streptomyces sp. OfavH-34-F]
MITSGQIQSQQIQPEGEQVRRTGTTRRNALAMTGALAAGAVLPGCGSDADDADGARGDSARSGTRAAADGASA